MQALCTLLLQQEIRSVELGVCPMQLFHFWSHDVHPVQNLLLCTKFHRNRMIFRWDMAIYRFSKWRPSAILELFYHHTRKKTAIEVWHFCKGRDDTSKTAKITSLRQKKHKYDLTYEPCAKMSIAAYCKVVFVIFECFAYLAWNASSGPQNGVLGDFGPLNVIKIIETPTRHILA